MAGRQKGPLAMFNLTKMRKDADVLMSLLVRLQARRPDGLVQCYTCDALKTWDKMQNGHFVRRERLVTRWNLDNTRPQCFGCNVSRAGEQWKFGENLDQELGDGTAYFLMQEGSKNLSTPASQRKKWLADIICDFLYKLEHWSDNEHDELRKIRKRYQDICNINIY